MAQAVRRVHILGAGAVGLLHAAHLAQSVAAAGKTAVTLLLREPSKSAFLAGGSLASVVEQTGVPSQQHKPHLHLQDVRFDCQDSAPPADTSGTQRSEPISTLIVTTRAHQTWPALLPLIPRLSSRPTILLLQNGVLGTLRTVQERLPSIRPDIQPTFLLGLTTHGVTRSAGNPFQVQHVGFGHTVIGRASRPLSSLGHSAELGHGGEPDEAQDVLDMLGSAWSHLAVSVVPSDRLQAQLVLKLVVNSCLNPVVALLGCPNGGLFTLTSAASVPTTSSSSSSSSSADLGTEGIAIVQSLCDEIAPLALPLITPHEPHISNAQALAAVVLDVARKTAANRNSMLVDLAAGRETEIDFLNGFVVGLAAQQGRPMPLHAMLARLVRLRSALGKTPTP
ncbi:ketopantoate reductase PanE/ApbA C terminal-domain-containing protein [Entophlyctis helioformis]|nr:ketopantoate reductase PanE/ApbA C terminal-domain-containing protein [Entophlyctis helioformis]